MRAETASGTDQEQSAGNRFHIPAVTVQAVRGIAGAIATLAVTSFVIFTSLSVAPGDPVTQLLGGQSTEEARLAKREELGLDEPLLVRYWNWLTAAIQGDLGTSMTYRGSVSELVGHRLETTAVLVGLAALFVIVGGVAFGVIGGGSKRGRSVVAALVGLGVAVPSFVSASVLIGVFAVQLRWFPTFGTGDGALSSLWHLTLPAIALSLSYAAYVAQMTAAAMTEEREKEYVLTSRGRGVGEGVIVRKHILRNAAFPVLTASGLAVAGLVSGTVIVEQVFSVDGIGALLVSSVLSKDYAVVMAISMLIVIIFVVIMAAVDAVQVLLDPRLKAVV